MKKESLKLNFEQKFLAKLVQLNFLVKECKNLKLLEDLGIANSIVEKNKQRAVKKANDLE